MRIIDKSLLAGRAGLIGVSTLALATGVAVTPASAQDAAAAAQAPAGGNGGDAIVVTGFRQAIASSIRTKKDSELIVDSVTAEDVGKLPDISISDAISRLPGVAVQTQAGRGQQISIRGFSGDFTTALLNGRTIATIDDNRKFDFDQLPGDLFNKVDVYKTASADLLGAGLAGTVDMDTLDPLANKRTISINLQGELTGYHKLNPDLTNKGYKGNFIYIDKFADNTVGVSLGFSAIQSPVENKQYDAWGYPTDASGNLALGGAKWFANTNILYRQTGFGHIVYRPDSRFEMSIDALYSNYKYREYQRGLEIPLIWGGVPETNITAANGIQTSGTFSPVYAVQRNNYNTRDADTLAIGGNIKYGLNDHLKFVIDASYSRAHRHDNAYETYTGTGYKKSGAADTVTINLNSNGTYQLTPTLNYTDTNLFQLTDPQGWGYYTSPVVQAGYLNAPDFTDVVKQLRGTLHGDIDSGPFKSWEIGANYNDEKKTNAFTGFYLVPPPGTTSVPVPAAAIVGSVQPAYDNTQTLAYSVPAVLGVLTGTFRNQQPSESTKQWSVEERVLTGFAQVNFDARNGDNGKISGNFGVQVVYTDQESIGNTSATVNSTLPFDEKAKFTYFLPSFNLNMTVDANSILRLAASRTLARSKFADENASFTVSTIAPGSVLFFPQINGKYVVLSGSGGNAYLRPYFSDNVDVSLEHYFAHGQGILAIDGFVKHVTNFVEPNKNYIADLSGYAGLINLAALPPAAQANYGLLGYVASPQNTGSGWVEGIEAQATVPLNILSHALDGFGVLGSVSYTDSALRYSGGQAVTLPGLSDWVANAQAYYEKNGFNARVSYQYRADFQGEYLAFGAQPQLFQTKGGSNLDAQIGYDFKSGPLNGLSIYLQGHNLTNKPFVTYSNGDKRQILNYETYGPTYLAGATFKF